MLRHALSLTSFHRYLLLASGLLVCTSQTFAQTAQDDPDLYNQVQSILSDRCYACHGPDASQRATDLRLDDRTSVLDASSHFVVPGKPDESELIQRIESDDTDMRMPPADQIKQLTDREKQLLRQWVEQGADWEKHWSFRPLPEQPTWLASPDDLRWPGPAQRIVTDNPIDTLVLKRLRAFGVTPSPPADPQTLLRRLHFDLTGLPPSVERLQQFEEAMEREGFKHAYHQQVDRLLASPQFGERMAVHWLDLVRYADTVGYHGDQPVSISPYRDWVIQAFNQNMPFDQFTREQLAGDLLPDATQQQLIASGYNRLGMMSAEGGVQPEEYLLKYAADRVRTTATTWLGLTMGCAECHDHKYDPITMKDFYRMSAFFADIKEQGLYGGSDVSGKWGEYLNVVDPQLPQLLAPIDEQLNQLRSQMGTDQEAQQAVVQWEASLQQDSTWQPLALDKLHSVQGAQMDSQPDHSVLVSGTNPVSDTYLAVCNLKQGTQSLRLEVMSDASLPAKGPGRAANGNLVVTELVLLKGDGSQDLREVQQRDQLPEDWQPITFQSAQASVEQAGSPHPDGRWSAGSAIDGDQHGATVGWALLPEVGRDHELVIQLKQPLDEGNYTILILQNHGTHHTVGRFRLSQSNSAQQVSPRSRLPRAIFDLLHVAPQERSPEQWATLRDYWRSIADQYKEVRQQIQSLQQQREQLVNQHTRSTLITVSVPAREVRVLPRGNWMDKSGPVVKPGIPEVLQTDAPDENLGRLDLANWLTSRDNPLTARVFVNRLWRIYFGHGLSRVLDDLGVQGQPPTHPLLLDDLASHFAQHWDVKDVIRLIVTSNTYQQSSDFRADLQQQDPENRWLARQGRFRLDAEFIRDQALSVSGLLVDKIGGPSVFPYQPAGLYRHLNFPTRTYQPSTGDDQYRRGLYTHWQRQFLHPAMKTFDAPAREECTAARPRSSTPLAALLLLNDPSYVEAARQLADRIQKEASTETQRMELLFRLCFSRSITPTEHQILSDLFGEHQQYYQQHPDQARQLLSTGQSAAQLRLAELPEATLAEWAAWTSVCRSVMNMHEFISRR